MSDSLLIEQCKKRNRKAQLAIYNKYCEGMFIVANRYMKDTALAQDAMQDAFIKAFTKLSQFKGDVTFGAWLKRIVINTCLDTIKAQKGFMVQLNEEMVGKIPEEEGHTVPDSATVDEVKKTMSQLPEKYKVVTQLFYLEGFDHAEISEVLKISEASSRTLLFRGKKLLQEQLKHLQYGTGY